MDLIPSFVVIPTVLYLESVAQSVVGSKLVVLGYVCWYSHVRPGTALIKIMCVHYLHRQGLIARSIQTISHKPRDSGPRNTLKWKIGLFLRARAA